MTPRMLRIQIAMSWCFDVLMMAATAMVIWMAWFLWTWPPRVLQAWMAIWAVVVCWSGFRLFLSGQKLRRSMRELLELIER